jgi:hypothetical protein
MFAYNIYRSYGWGLGVQHVQEKSDLVENSKIEDSAE